MKTGTVLPAALLLFISLFPFSTNLSAQTMPTSRGDMNSIIGEELMIPEPRAYTINVDQAVELAMEYNLTLVGDKAGLKTTKRTRDTAWNVLIPSATASTTLRRFSEPAGLPLEERYGSLGAGLSFSLTLTPQLWYAFRKTVNDYDHGLMELDQARQDLTVNIKKQFYSLLTQQENIKILELQQRSLEKRSQQADTNYNFGLVDEYTRLSALVALENFKPQVEIARDEYEQSLLGFKLSLGINLDSRVELDGRIEAEPRTFDADRLIGKYMLDRLDIRSLVVRLQGIDNNRKLASSGYLPSLTLGYNLDNSFNLDPWSDLSFAGDDWSDSRTFSLTFSMSLSELLPVSDTTNKVRAAEDGREALRAGLAQALQTAEVEILTTVQTINKSVQLIKAKELNVELAQRAYNLAEEAYNAGGKSLLDVEDAEDKLQEARFELLREKVNYINGIIDLEAAVNRRIDEIEIAD
ncbi:TolC family protein [Marispirochaeta sp.]|jgi:outer membrane protein TolC|uniref:TolC family protein n=1 Tax=Marispirochaeta sp. TaxID=2038653 RepID=UPI0029C698E4|nr:TolC family protein [Marispirochaeta sp.]